MEYSYVWEKFFGAMMSLVGELPLRARLEYAAQSIIALKHQTIPEDVKDDVMSLIEDLTSGNPDGEEGKIHATIKRMSDEEARDTAKRILGYYDKIARHRRPH
jgi:hemerythrin superfamily protein